MDGMLDSLRRISWVIGRMASMVDIRSNWYGSFAELTELMVVMIAYSRWDRVKDWGQSLRAR